MNLIDKGIYIEEKLIKHHEEQSILFDYGRKGGTGCINSFLAKLIDGQTVNQKLYRYESNTTTKKGYKIYICNECRKVCPYGTGIK